MNTNKQATIKVIIMYKFVKIEIAHSPHESYDKKDEIICSDQTKRKFIIYYGGKYDKYSISR